MFCDNTMAGDDELEQRAIEELLRETDRARLRAETMGPAGWLKCPLQGTNKRFLLNTLRSTGLQRGTGEPRVGHSTTRGRMRSESPDRSRDRSRTPRRSSPGDRTVHEHPHGDSRSKRDKKRDRDKERNCRLRENRHHEQGGDTRVRDKNKARLHE